MIQKQGIYSEARLNYSDFQYPESTAHLPMIMCKKHDHDSTLFIQTWLRCERGQLDQLLSIGQNQHINKSICHHMCAKSFQLFRRLQKDSHLAFHKCFQYVFHSRSSPIFLRGLLNIVKIQKLQMHLDHGDMATIFDFVSIKLDF